MENILTVKNLVMKFKNKAVLKNIDLTVKKGEIIFIIGPSGCGKSTFLRCLNRLLIPTRGEIIFEGQDLKAKKTNINLIRQKMGMVFQSYNLFPHLTVLENLTLAPLKLHLMTKEEANTKAIDLLKSIALENKKKVYPNSLSGGEKQRIAIIRSMMIEPSLLLFDEPTSALDPAMVKEVTSLMESLGEKGMTMIIVSHEMNFVKEFATRVLFMKNGKILEEGTPKEIFNNPKCEDLKNFLSK